MTLKRACLRPVSVLARVRFRKGKVTVLSEPSHRERALEVVGRPRVDPALIRPVARGLALLLAVACLPSCVPVERDYGLTWGQALSAEQAPCSGEGGQGGQGGHETWEVSAEKWPTGEGGFMGQGGAPSVPGLVTLLSADGMCSDEIGEVWIVGAEGAPLCGPCPNPYIIGLSSGSAGNLGSYDPPSFTWIKAPSFGFNPYAFIPGHCYAEGLPAGPITSQFRAYVTGIETGEVPSCEFEQAPSFRLCNGAEQGGRACVPFPGLAGCPDAFPDDIMLGSNPVDSRACTCSCANSTTTTAQAIVTRYADTACGSTVDSCLATQQSALCGSGAIAFGSWSAVPMPGHEAISVAVPQGVSSVTGDVAYGATERFCCAP